jgi:hypothetical protein
MTKFTDLRPDSYIKSPEELNIGDIIYMSLSLLITDRQTVNLGIIISKPCEYADHKNYSDIHVNQKDEVVFDVEHVSYGYVNMEFFVSHGVENNNYMFATESDFDSWVQKQRDWVKANPEDWKNHVEKRKYFLKSLYDSDYDDY